MKALTLPVELFPYVVFNTNDSELLNKFTEVPSISSDLVVTIQIYQSRTYDDQLIFRRVYSDIAYPDEDQDFQTNLVYNYDIFWNYHAVQNFDHQLLCSNFDYLNIKSFNNKTKSTRFSDWKELTIENLNQFLKPSLKQYPIIFIDIPIQAINTKRVIPQIIDLDLLCKFILNSGYGNRLKLRLPLMSPFFNMNSFKEYICKELFFAIEANNPYEYIDKREQYFEMINQQFYQCDIKRKLLIDIPKVQTIEMTLNSLFYCNEKVQIKLPHLKRIRIKIELKFQIEEDDVTKIFDTILKGNKSLEVLQLESEYANDLHVRRQPLYLNLSKLLRTKSIKVLTIKSDRFRFQYDKYYSPIISNLEILKISNNPYFTDFDINNRIKFPYLKQLQLIDNSSLESLDFIKESTNLKILRVSECSSFVGIIGMNLPSLNKLNINHHDITNYCFKVCSNIFQNLKIIEMSLSVLSLKYENNYFPKLQRESITCNEHLFQDPEKTPHKKIFRKNKTIK